MSARPELRASNVALDFKDATPDDVAEGDALGARMVHVSDQSDPAIGRRQDVTYVMFGGSSSPLMIAGRRDTVRWLLTEALRQLDALDTEDGAS